MSKYSVDENGYTENPEDLYKAENEYIKKRRIKNQVCELLENDGCKNIKHEGDKSDCGLSKDDDCRKLWGICFSGGGIRSATFCLGVIQGLIEANIFRFFTKCLQ